MSTRIQIDLPRGTPCYHCNGMHFAIFEVWDSGFSAGSGYHHKPDCKTLFCEHGKLRPKGTEETTCAECLAAEQGMRDALDDVE